MTTIEWGREMTHPSETEIARVMADTGMARMQAINHLRGRMMLRDRAARSFAEIATGSAFLDGLEASGARLCAELRQIPEVW